MLQASSRARPCRNILLVLCRIAGGMLPAAILLAACQPAPQAAMHGDTIARLPARPIDTDPAVAEKMGRAALKELGYEKIMHLAEEAGWIEYKPSRSGNVLGQAVGFWPVFTRYAIAAGVASQVDSPAPGPGDVVAIGILVVGLIDAALISGAALSTAVGNPAITAAPTAVAPPAVPTARPFSTTTPVPTHWPIPVPMPIDMVKRPTPEVEEQCQEWLVECLGRKQPERNRSLYGDRQPCDDCAAECKKHPKGEWPVHKCPWH